MSEWISVKDRLPEHGAYVLVWLDGEDAPIVADYRPTGWSARTDGLRVGCMAYCYGGMIENDFNQQEITHWMPLPEPPEADNGQDA